MATFVAGIGCATADESRKVALRNKTKRDYSDLVAFCRVDANLDPDYFGVFIEDIYKTGWEDVSALIVHVSALVVRAVRTHQRKG